MSFSLRKAAPSAFSDDFSVRWAGLVQRSKKSKLFRRRAEHGELVREFESLLSERKGQDDLPYAALVALSLARYLESCAEPNQPQGAAYLEASECFWEAAHQDHLHGCTDPPEVLRLQARDAQARALQWTDKCIQSDIYLRASQHLCRLQEYDEAAFLAERSAEIEAASLDNAFDAYIALGQSVKCHALNKNYVKVEQVLKSVLERATKALDADSAWTGFSKGPVPHGWQSSWAEEAIFHAGVSHLLLSVVTGRNMQMEKWLTKVKELLLVRDGELGIVWASLNQLVNSKRSESESALDADQCRAAVLLVVREEYAQVLLEAAISTVILQPNWDFEKDESKIGS